MEQRQLRRRSLCPWLTAMDTMWPCSELDAACCRIGCSSSSIAGSMTYRARRCSSKTSLVRLPLLFGPNPCGAALLPTAGGVVIPLRTTPPDPLSSLPVYLNGLATGYSSDRTNLSTRPDPSRGLAPPTPASSGICPSGLPASLTCASMRRQMSCAGCSVVFSPDMGTTVTSSQASSASLRGAALCNARVAACRPIMPPTSRASPPGMHHAAERKGQAG
eukprot:scaffold1397_cov254-Pinguiococcus_pyrenoidosus.AAC.19